LVDGGDDILAVLAHKTHGVTALRCKLANLYAEFIGPS
jgi:hypothetical protein